MFKSVVVVYMVCLVALIAPVIAKPNSPPESTENKTESVSLPADSDFAAAIPLLHDIAKKHADKGQIAEQLEALMRIADAQAALGNERRMLRTLQYALGIALQAHQMQHVLLIQPRLATAYLYSGDFAKARQSFDALLHTEGFTKDASLQISTFNDMGNLDSYEGKYDQALMYYRQSAELAKKRDDHASRLRALSNALSVAQLANQVAQPGLIFDELMQGLPLLNESEERALILFKLATAMQRFALDSEVYRAQVLPLTKALTKAIDSLAPANHRDASLLYGALAGLYEQAGQHQDALPISERATFAAQQLGDLELLYQWQWQQARLHNHLGHANDSLRAYRLAVQSLQPIKDQMADNKLGKSTAYRYNDGSVYLELADQLLQSTDAVQGAAERQGLLVEARQTMEMQKEAELQDYFRDSCLINAKTQISSIDQSIGSRTAIIYPILLPTRTELLVSFKDGIQRYVIDKTSQDVTEQVRALRTKLEKRRTRDYLPYSQRLYQWLIAPLEADLQKRDINTLVMVAGQSLRTIPISVFHDGEQFLVNRFAVATTPGLMLTDARPLKRDTMRVLLSGITESVQGYPALNYVRGELEEIQDLYVGKLLLNRDFVTASLGNAMRASNYSVTHIASHSVFTGDIRDSYILTYDGRLTMNQLGELASVGRDRNQPIDLITLSACQTAAGDDRAALGLAGVAIKSGARSALATLWTINDQASSLLVTEFYRQLQDQTVSKAEALQRAQTKLMGNVRYRHPGYWSPFLLIGNWM